MAVHVLTDIHVSVLLEILTVFGLLFRPRHVNGWPLWSDVHVVVVMEDPLPLQAKPTPSRRCGDLPPPPARAAFMLSQRILVWKRKGTYLM